MIFKSRIPFFNHCSEYLCFIEMTYAAGYEKMEQIPCNVNLMDDTATFTCDFHIHQFQNEIHFAYICVSFQPF